MCACCILYYLANLFFFPLEMLKILPFELVNNHFSVRNYFFFFCTRCHIMFMPIKLLRTNIPVQLNIYP